MFKTIVLTLTLAAAAAAAPPPVQSVRLYVFDCGKLTVTDPIRFNFKKDELKTLDLSVGCYLVVHPKGTLMWDVGAVPDSAFKNDGKPGVKEYATSPKPLRAQLAEAGYKPEDITYLMMSHYHWDHVANASEFAKSTWLVRRIERETLFGPCPPERISPDQVGPLKGSKTTYLPDNADYDVFGDGTVVIKPAYGHTPGHSVLYVKLAKTGGVVLSGDLYHYPEEVTTGRIPLFEYNASRTKASRESVEAFIKRSGSQLWIQHDLAQFSTLKKAPGYYE
jgi:N-acyl homoserine lactone hydrolase